MLRLRNLSCFIVPADVRHAIFHLFVMQSACMLAHIIMSAPLLLPPPPTPFGLFVLKIKSRFMSMERHGRQREENLLTKTCDHSYHLLLQAWSISTQGTSLLILESRAKCSKLEEIAQYQSIFSSVDWHRWEAFMHSRPLSSLWHEQRQMRRYNGWLIQKGHRNLKKPPASMVLGCLRFAPSLRHP